MSAPPLPGFFGTIAPTLDHYGYLAVAAFIMLEDFGIPLPGETVLIAAALYAGTGRLNIVAVCGGAVVAAGIRGKNGHPHRPPCGPPPPPPLCAKASRSPQPLSKDGRVFAP